MGACGDTFARNRAQIAILVILSMGRMDPTAASRTGMRILPAHGAPSFYRVAMSGAPDRARLLGLIGLGVTPVAPGRSDAFRSAP
jgi:hypothetical protein